MEVPNAGGRTGSPQGVCQPSLLTQLILIKTAPEWTNQKTFSWFSKSSLVGDNYPAVFFLLPFYQLSEHAWEQHILLDLSGITERGRIERVSSLCRSIQASSQDQMWASSFLPLALGGILYVWLVIWQRSKAIQLNLAQIYSRIPSPAPPTVHHVPLFWYCFGIHTCLVLWLYIYVFAYTV